MNPDRLREFLVQPPHGGSTLRMSSKSAGANSSGVTFPSLKSASLASMAEAAAMMNKSNSHGPHAVLQEPPLQRGELKVFQTTFRGGANLLAPPAPRAVVMAPTLAAHSPDVGQEGGRSLRRVWEKSLFAHAAGLILRLHSGAIANG